MNIKSTSNIVEVHFDVSSMDALDDYNDLFFEGTWDFVKTVPCLNKRRVRGPSGELKYHLPILLEEEVRNDYLLFRRNITKSWFSQKNCENHPWLIDPGPRQYLYVKTHGIVAANMTNCATKNRIVIHTAGGQRVSVCPKPSSYSRRNIVEVFSDGWNIIGNKGIILPPDQNPTKTVAVEFIMTEEDSYSVTWLELSRRYVILYCPYFFSQSDGSRGEQFCIRLLIDRFSFHISFRAPISRNKGH